MPIRAYAQIKQNFHTYREKERSILNFCEAKISQCDTHNHKTVLRLYVFRLSAQRKIRFAKDQSGTVLVRRRLLLFFFLFARFCCTVAPVNVRMHRNLWGFFFVPHEHTTNARRSRRRRSSSPPPHSQEGLQAFVE